MSLYSELKRRNVFRVGATYAVVAWLLIEIADTIFPRLNLPDWTVTLVVALAILAFPLALILAWAYEITPEGMQRAATGDADAPAAARHQAWRRLDLLLIAVLLLAAGHVRDRSDSKRQAAAG